MYIDQNISYDLVISYFRPPAPVSISKTTLNKISNMCGLNNVTGGLTDVKLVWVTQTSKFVHNVREQESRRLAFQREIATHLSGLEDTSQINIKHVLKNSSHFAFKQ